MKILDLICAWALMILGAVRCVLALLHGQISGGMGSVLIPALAVIATGMLNVIRGQGGKAALSRVFAIICNLVLITALVAQRLAAGSLVPGTTFAIVVLVVAALETVFSISRSK